MYMVTLHGSGLVDRIADTNSILKLGFYTTRWVRARDPHSAVVIARQLVFDELGETRAPETPESSVTLEVDEIAQPSWFAALKRRTSGRGFAFYPEDRYPEGFLSWRRDVTTSSNIPLFKCDTAPHRDPGHNAKRENSGTQYRFQIVRVRTGYIGNRTDRPPV